MWKKGTFMLKKIVNIIFVILFLAVIFSPMLFADLSSGEISESENRYLAQLPQLFVEGKLNDNFSSDVESWFMDHMGFRQELIQLNAGVQYRIFNRLLNQSNYYLGPDGDLNYATDAMIRDYAHVNLRSAEKVQEIANSYQIVSDYAESQGAQFYYVQCYDKHSIYPEQFMDTINQYGSISKTDQVIEALLSTTTVKTISLKQVLIDSKEEYEVYSNWGDPTHWSKRGAFIGYQVIMDKISQDNGGLYPVLQEEDLGVKITDQAQSLSWYKYTEEYLETFWVKDSHVVSVDKSVMGQWASDARHFAWKNDSIGNGKKLLLFCDSYIAAFNPTFYAESFSEVWLIRANYTKDLPAIIELYNPDVIIYECAERVDCSTLICSLADQLQ